MNEYQQIYHVIENEITELSYSIAFSVKHKSVYSPKIADLILRSASLLESAIKYQYKEISGENVKYDQDKVIDDLGLRDKMTYAYWDMYNFKKKISVLLKKMRNV